MKITLPLWDAKEKKWVVVEGAELVDVAPHLSGTFAVHRCPWSCNAMWVVTNVETGAKVPSHFFDQFTRRDAIKAARAYLATKTEAELQKRFVACLAEFGECHSA